jgi:hypothetical protein
VPGTLVLNLAATLRQIGATPRSFGQVDRQLGARAAFGASRQLQGGRSGSRPYQERRAAAAREANLGLNVSPTSAHAVYRCLAKLRARRYPEHLWPPLDGMSAPIWVVVGLNPCAHAVKGPGWGLEHERDQPDEGVRVSVRTAMNNITPTSSAGAGDPIDAFAELARIVVDAEPPDQTLRRIARLAKQTLGDIEDVSLTVIENGRARSVVFTGALAVELDERQYEIGFGPCTDAAKSGQTIVVDTGEPDGPYGEFARVANRAGVRHVISVGMPLDQRSAGGLNIYSSAEAPVSQAVLEQAEVFAGYAAVVVANITSHAAAVNEATHLRKAMESRAVIEQAKGMIMVRDRCTADEAFMVLTRISQHRNIKLRDLAQGIVDAVQK